MKNKIKSIFFMMSILLISNYCSIAQSLQSNSNSSVREWTSSNPFKTDVFVENHGQFDEWAKFSIPVKYAVNNADKIFFTTQGVIFKLEKFEALTEEELEKKEKQEALPSEKENNIFYVSMNWEGCNADAELIAINESEGYYTYGEKGFENLQAKGYKKLLYKNIYPNIDVEYIIPEKGGIKYNLILHPGANITQVKMKYSGAVEKIKKDKKGNILIQTPAGNITDHTPLSYYEGNNTEIASAFHVRKNTISFKLDLDKQNVNNNTATLLIDPWTTTPTSLTTSNAALDIDYDVHGNVFVSGGSVPFKLTKYSNTGVFQWTFTNPIGWSNGNNYYSKFCVLPLSGTAYIGEAWAQSSSGAKIIKINPNGTLNYTSAVFGNNNEIFIMFYNNCSKQLIAFGGGTLSNNHNMKIIADTNLSNSVSSNYNGFCSYKNDVASVRMDNNGDFYAIATSNSCSTVEGKLQKSLYSLNYAPPCTFDVQSNCYFNEVGSLGLTNFTTVRANALAMNGNYLYSYDGKNLKAWNKNNGNLISSVIVDNSYPSSASRVHEGIDVDGCNNVFVGGTNMVHVYTFNGTSFIAQTSITANIPNKVHDIRLNAINGSLYVCGLGFVTEVNSPFSCNNSAFLNVYTTVDSCSGNACVHASGGLPPYVFQWSNGSTDSCINGVPAGTYTVTVKDNSCMINNYVDTITFNVSNQISITPSHPVICKGDSITLTATANIVTPFLWSTGFTGNTITVSPLNTTTYYVTNVLCPDSVSVTVNVSPISHTVLNPSICQGDLYQVGIHFYNANGTYNDTLSSIIGCDSIISTNLTIVPPVQSIINPSICYGDVFHFGIHTYSSSGIYKDTLSTVIGCDSVITIILNVLQLTHDLLGSDTSICFGEPIVLNASLPNASYQWQDGSTNPIFIVSEQGLYWVKAKIDSCNFMDSLNVAVIDCEVILQMPNIITPNGDALNDIFLPVKIKNVIKMHTQIFNRWGGLIYETDNLNVEWDGKHNGKFVAEGVYYWVINYTEIKGVEKMIKGSLTVMN